MSPTRHEIETELGESKQALKEEAARYRAEDERTRKLPREERVGSMNEPYARIVAARQRYEAARRSLRELNRSENPLPGQHTRFETS